MNNINLVKRTILLCVFFMFACSEPAQESSDSAVRTANNQENVEELQNPPLLSLQELLSASDVRNALANAAAENDIEALKLWQSILLEAALEVDLLSQEKKLLEGQQGLVFLEFQGMKVNYQRAFENAFYEFQDLEKVYSDYPAFKNLHAKSRQLVIERDQLVSTVANELKSQGFEGDAMAEARKQWQNFVNSEQQKALSQDKYMSDEK